MSNGVQKLIVVGEPETGKTALIQAFLDYEGELNASLVGGAQGNSNKQPGHKLISANSDFSMKIIRIDGAKARLQLWDQGLGKDPQSVFQPLFVRHAAGCIVVANTINLQTIKKAPTWKTAFDGVTKVQDEPAYPCTLFINHHEFVPYEDQQRLRNLELQAGEEGTFYGIYHVSLGDPASVYAAFEGFVARLLDEAAMAQRTSTERFLDDAGNATIKFRQSQLEKNGRTSMYAAGGGVGADAGGKGGPGEGEETFSGGPGQFDTRPPNEDGTFRLSRVKSGSIRGPKRKCAC